MSAVVLHMKDGSAVRLDRGLRLDVVAKTINKARGFRDLVRFPNDLTPSRDVWVDPAEVARIEEKS